MKVEDLEGWCAEDTPGDGYMSEGEFDPQALVSVQNKKKNKTGCGFQAMGLSQPILKGILHKGYRIPTPIQRKSIPTILEGKDIVAMARTGSGKTAAFLIPLFERLKLHSARGAEIRGLILSPTRELALQTLTFAKQLGKYTGIRAALVLGGDSMEVQFQAISENPDIIIATPGRFMHVCIQMSLELSSVDYVVFDEADRLFEMGFSQQLRDIIGRLNPNRQTLLFSATLPKMLVEFARAGLTDPVLIRLDVENKISEQLKLSFFQVRNEERLPLLIHLLKEVINLERQPTVLFVPTKHHVEHLHLLLEKTGIANTYIYSSLDPAARKIHAEKFRKRKVNLLIVTDIAARGIDIPLLDNVINFNFPDKTKLFVHRVGRVARAGREGFAYSLVSADETPYLIELHMFINKAIKFAPQDSSKNNTDWNFMFGKVPREVLEDNFDHIEKLHVSDCDLLKFRSAAENGYIKYRKSCTPASQESVKRLKRDMWDSELGYHPLLVKKCSEGTGGLEKKRSDMLDRLKNVRPKLTIFEVRKFGTKKKEANVVQFMEDKRKMDNGVIGRYHKKVEDKRTDVKRKQKLEEIACTQRNNLEQSSEAMIDNTFQKVVGRKRKKGRRNVEVKASVIETRKTGTDETENQHFIPYEQADRIIEEALAVNTGFTKSANDLALDIKGDENREKKSQFQKKVWSRTLKKYVTPRNTVKKVKTESGVWVNASYTTDIYQKWKLKSQKTEQDDDIGDEPSESQNNPESDTGKDSSENKSFVTLNQNYASKKHPLLKGKKFSWTLPGKKQKQQLKSKKELFSYEERNKNWKAKKRALKADRKKKYLNKVKKLKNVKDVKKKSRKGV